MSYWGDGPFHVIGRGEAKDCVIVEIDSLRWEDMKHISWPKYAPGDAIPDNTHGWETFTTLLWGLGNAVRATGQWDMTTEPVENPAAYCLRVGEAMAEWARKEIAEQEASLAKFSAIWAQQDAERKARDE